MANATCVWAKTHFGQNRTDLILRGRKCEKNDIFYSRRGVRTAYVGPNVER